MTENTETEIQETQTQAQETEVEQPKFAEPAPGGIRVNKSCTCC
jgi:hypothetical protein